MIGRLVQFAYNFPGEPGEEVPFYVISWEAPHVFLRGTVLWDPQDADWGSEPVNISIKDSDSVRTVLDPDEWL